MSRGAPARTYERLRLVRGQRSSFESRFFERSPEFWPLARAAQTFADHDDWPNVGDYARAFEGEAAVRFEEAKRGRKRGGDVPISRVDLYDAVIVNRRVVPTRPRMWHDFLNAMVWATFPAAKLALHRRQHVAIERWIPAGATQLPNARTRELDALALVDEGGMLLLDHGRGGERQRILFGHALFEGLVFEQPAMPGRAVVLDASAVSPPTDRRHALALADELLAKHLSTLERVVSPDELERMPL
jgi:hypothetical protein